MAALEPFIAAQVACLQEFKGLSFRVEDIRKGSELAEYADRFTVVVPFCLDTLKWDIIYNSNQPWVAPDVVFGPEEEGFFPLLQTVGKSATPRGSWQLLKGWVADDSARLLRLIVELRNLLLQHQRHLVELVDDARIKFEIGTLAGIEGLELSLATMPDGSKEVQMVIPLSDVDPGSLVPRTKAIASSRSLMSLAQTDQKFVLNVRYPLNKGSQLPLFRIIIPPCVVDWVQPSDIKIPTWTEKMCLMEYLPLMQESLKNLLRDLGQSVLCCRDFLTALPNHLGRPLETDTEKFRGASVFVQDATFTFLVHFHLPAHFPKASPLLIFQSSQYFDTQMRPLLLHYDGVPWSPRWDADEMARRLSLYVASEAASFKAYCMENLGQRR